MKEKFVPTESNQKQSEKTYPPISQKELSSYKTPEDWLDFFKRYDLIPPETTFESLSQKSVTIKHNDIIRRTGTGFQHFKRRKSQGHFNPQIPGVSIEVRTRKPLGFWTNMTKETFYEELIKAGVDINNPPALNALPRNARNAIKTYSHLYEAYEELYMKAGKTIKKNAPRNAFNDIDWLVDELQKEGVIIDDLLRKQITRSLGNKWKRRIRQYGGKIKFLEALSATTAITVEILKSPPPLGWLTTGTLINQFQNIGIGKLPAAKTLRKIAHNLKITYPNQFSNCLVKGRLREHFSPEIAEKIKQAVLERYTSKNGEEEKIDSEDANQWLMSLMETK